MPVYMLDAAQPPMHPAGYPVPVLNHYLTGRYAGTSWQPVETLAAGKGSLLTYEEDPAELVGATRTVGQLVGSKIRTALIAARVPLDGSVAVYPSVDVMLSLGALGACDAGFLGIRDVIGGEVSVRCYGEGALIQHLADARLIDGPGWLSASTSYPGWNPASPSVCVVQGHDATGQTLYNPWPGTDLNTVKSLTALGAWWARPIPSPGEDEDMYPYVIKDAGSPGALLMHGNGVIVTIHDAQSLESYTSGTSPFPEKVVSSDEYAKYRAGAVSSYPPPSGPPPSPAPAPQAGALDAPPAAQ